MDEQTRALVDSVRRFLEEVVHTERQELADGEPSIGEVVGAHLGADVRGVPVVREEVPPHQFVDLDIALGLLAERGGGERVVGVGGGEQPRRLRRGRAHRRGSREGSRDHVRHSRA